MGQQSENQMQNMSCCLIFFPLRAHFVQNKPRMNTLYIKDKKYYWVNIILCVVFNIVSPPSGWHRNLRHTVSQFSVGSTGSEKSALRGALAILERPRSSCGPYNTGLIGDFTLSSMKKGRSIRLN